MTSKDFSLQLLKRKRVAVVPGTAFGTSGEGYVRCCFATGMDKLKEAMKRIEEFVQEISRTQ
jgi:aminotransferase